MLTGSYSTIIIFMVLFWFIQIGLSYFQYQNYQKALNQIKQRSDGYLGVGVARAKFKLGRGVITLLVTDEAGKILDYQEMSGLTIFARFKTCESYIGKNVEELTESLKGKQRIRSFNQATELINQEILKMEVV